MRQREERQLEEAERQRVQNAIARAQALAAIAQLVSGAQLSAANLSLLMSEAGSALDLAEKEFSDGLYSPFWEAMESAAQSLHSFDKTLQAINSAQQRYAIEAQPLKPDAVSFSLGITVLPSPSFISHRMKDLYRKVRKDPHFAQIYEQRRTNSILIEGFRSLGDALTYLGDRIESELQSVGSRVEFRLADIDSALRDSSKQMERQQQALLQEAKSWREEARSGNAELAAIARRNAEQAENSAWERRDMLDNIQHHRKPSLLSGH